MKLNNLILPFILILAFLFRSYNLSTYPALNPDEASLGYSAYSLLQTGKDEFGARFPLHFKSFGDYKPGGYVYLALPFIKVLGLTPLAIRLPNLILSIIAIYFFYQLVHLLFQKNSLALLSALVLSLNPWHIHFSRGAWESSAALTFILIGTYFFYKFLKVRITVYGLLVTFFFSLSLYFYHSARIFAPSLLLSLLIIHHKNIFNNIKKLILPLILGCLLTLPVLVSFVKNGGSARFGGIGITADQGPIWRANELLNHHQSVSLPYRIIHNKRILYLLSWSQKYLSHFDFNYLFINGDEVPRSKTPEMGQFYLLELPLLVFGFIYLIRSKLFPLQSKIFIFSWLFLAPLASSLTFQAPSALRSLPLVIPLSFFISLGLYHVLNRLVSPLPARRGGSKGDQGGFKIGHWLLITVYCLLITYYLDSYHNHYQKRYPFAWNYGFGELIPYLQSVSPSFENIYVTNKYDQPYILYLFYSQFSPIQAQKELVLTPPNQYGFSTVTSIGKYHFQIPDWNSIPKNSIIAASSEKIPLDPILTIGKPKNNPVFKIYQKP